MKIYRVATMHTHGDRCHLRARRRQRWHERGQGSTMGDGEHVHVVCGR